MQANITEQIEALKSTETKLLLDKWRENFGDSKPPANRLFLIRHLAYKLQESTHGPLAAAVKNTIQDLIRTYDPINKRTFKTRGGNISTPHGRDPRLPMPGSLITKIYKNNRIEVKVLEQGFEYRGTIYKNLSAVAEAITGNHWNGFVFFGLNHHGRR
ncbi:MAG: DUF2924 domain-containing protein [Candidatus Omnitrophica bacterium]|nr:DUF2924 domain-containing protein [Candidatus Omnitrophota bacterium]MDD5670033.1 DUF2924 domain-containing protein [Candidatus Omnitrophota bacterium]